MTSKMARLKASLLLSIFLTSLVKGQMEPEVEIEDYFGDVNFHSGITQEIRCQVFDPVERGELKWRLGDQVVGGTQTRREEEEEEEAMVKSFNFTPTIPDDNQSLQCEYWTPSGDVYSDKVTLHIFMMEVSPVTPHLVEEGSPLTLEATALLYPAPDPKNVVWQVAGRDGDVKTRMHPGSQDEYGIYQAEEMQNLSENLYKMDFLIGAVDQEQVGMVHSLTVTTLGVKKTVEFDITLRLRQAEENPGINYADRFNSSEPFMVEEQPEVTTSNIGIFIIIGVMIVLVIICLVCCFYRKKKKTKTNNSQTYTAVQTVGPGAGHSV